MEDETWDTVAAHRLAALIPSDERAELLNLLPGFTAIPHTPFERPDGSAYIRNYTKVLYGTPEQAMKVLADAGITHFLFDTSATSSVLWAGFAPLFEVESITQRMRLVTHQKTRTKDLFLLTWRSSGETAYDPALEQFAMAWSAKRKADSSGFYAASYRQAVP